MFTKQNIITANHRVSRNLVKVQDIPQENKLKFAKLNLDIVQYFWNEEDERAGYKRYTHTHMQTWNCLWIYYTWYDFQNKPEEIRSSGQIIPKESKRVLLKPWVGDSTEIIKNYHVDATFHEQWCKLHSRKPWTRHSSQLQNCLLTTTLYFRPYLQLFHKSWDLPLVSMHFIHLSLLLLRIIDQPTESKLHCQGPN